MRDRTPIVTQQKQVKEATEAAINAAKKLYSMTEFAEYRQKVIVMKKQAMHLITNYVNPNAEQYAFYIQAKVRDYNNFSMLLGDIEAIMGVSNEEN